MEPDAVSIDEIEVALSKKDKKKKKEGRQRSWSVHTTTSERERLKAVEEPCYEKFSDFITSPIFTVIVGPEGTKTKFLIHSELLRKESDRFAAEMNPGFVEGEKKVIRLVDEDPNLFGYFVEYLYSTKWEALQRPSDLDQAFSKYVVLARLYTLGDRLQALAFQRAVFQEFMRSFHPQSMPEEAVCDLLEVACSEMLDKESEDPIHAQIFWCASSRLTALRKYPRFRKLQEDYVDIGNRLVRWASNTSKDQPKAPSGEFSYRFKAENVYA